MSWQDAIAAARELIGRTSLPKGSLRGHAVRLAAFEDEPTYIFLKGPDEWSFGFHGMVIRAAARELKARGAKVDFVEINLPDFWDWIEKRGLENNAATRAQFILAKTEC